MSQVPSGFIVPSDSNYTNSKIKLLRISGEWLQSIQFKALGSSELWALGDYTEDPHLWKLAFRGTVTQDNAKSKRTVTLFTTVAPHPWTEGDNGHLPRIQGQKGCRSLRVYSKTKWNDPQEIKFQLIGISIRDAFENKAKDQKTNSSIVNNYLLVQRKEKMIRSHFHCKQVVLLGWWRVGQVKRAEWHKYSLVEISCDVGV